MAASPTLSSTVSSWTSVFSAGDSINTTTSGSFSPPARSLITVAVAISSYFPPDNNPSYSISNTGTALTWTRRAHDRVNSGLGSDNNFTGEVVVYEAWNANPQTNITIAVVHAPTLAGAVFPVFTFCRAFVWVDAIPGGSHSTSGGSVNTTNNLTVSASAVINSRLVVAAVDGSRANVATSSDLTAATFTSAGSSMNAIVGHRLVGANPETFNLDANGTSAAEWVYASSQVYLKTEPDVGDNGSTRNLSIPSTTRVFTPTVAIDTTQAVTLARIEPATKVYTPTITAGSNQTITLTCIPATTRVRTPATGAPQTNAPCDGTPGTFVPYLAGSRPAISGGVSGVDMFVDFRPEPYGGWKGGAVWESAGAQQYEYRADVSVRRGQSYIRPALVLPDPASPQWFVSTSNSAGPQTSDFYQRSYHFLEAYPDTDAAFMWWEESYPFAFGPTEPVNWVGMCPWGRFELWTNGGNVRTDPNVIPLNKWFRVEAHVINNARKHRLTARIYFDSEAPVDGYDIELTSDWADNPSESAMVPYSPWTGGVGDTMGAPYTGTNADMKAYFDDVAFGPGAFGWIGPSGGALSHTAIKSTTRVFTPTVSQTQPLTDVGGIKPTTRVFTPNVTVTFNQTITLAPITATTWVRTPAVLDGSRRAVRISPTAPPDIIRS